MFASNGALFASVLPWYPTLMRQWGLSESYFGLIVACFALGSLASSAVPAPVVRRLGAVPAMAVGTAVMAVVLVLAGFVLSGGWTLALMLLVLGFLDPIVDVAQNLVAVRVQERLGRSIMSSVHASWSLGAACGGAAGTVAVGRMEMPWHFLVASLVACGIAGLGCVLVGDVAAVDDPASDGGAGISGVMALVAPIAVVAISGTMVEEVANSWAGLLAAEVAGMPVEKAGVALTVMLSAQCVGRFAGDPMVNRWGRIGVAKLGGACIAGGAAVAVLAPGPALFLCGLGAAGFGCATIVPSAFTAATQLPGVSEGAGLTAMSWLMRVGFLSASPLIGVASSATDVRAALVLLLVCGVTVLVLAKRLDPRAGLQR